MQVYIVRAFTGRGLMSEALELVMSFSKEVLNVHKISSGCFVENEGSKRVHLKAGFVSTGTAWVSLPPWRIKLFGARKEICVLSWTRT